MISRTIKIICLGIILSTVMCMELLAQCPNSNLEQGNLTNWNRWYGDYFVANTAMLPGTTTSGLVGPNVRPTAELEPANIPPTFGDWYFPTELQRVYEGNHSIRVGDIQHSENNHMANSGMVSYTFNVTSTNKDFKFWFALMAFNGWHFEYEQPGITWFMKLGAGTLANSAIPTGPTDPSWGIYNATKFQRVLARNPATDPWWTRTKGDTSIWFRPWSCQQYDLSNWVGQQVTIFMRVRDCGQYGHYCYAYVDGLCSGLQITTSATLPTTACWNPETPIILDGSATLNEDTYGIGIVQVFPPGTPLGTVLATGYSANFYGQVVPQDIRALYRNPDGTTRFKCGETYIVTLNPANTCGGMGSVEKRITITCPPVNAGPDKTVCCGQSVTIGGTLPGGGRFSWSPKPIGATTSGQYMTFTPTDNGTYTFNVEDNNRCRNFDEVNVTVKKDFSLSVSENCPTETGLLATCADYYTLTANVRELVCQGNSSTAPVDPNNFSYSWTYAGLTWYGRTIPTPAYLNGNDSIRLTVSDSCFSRSLTYKISCPKFEGNIPIVAFAPSLAPNNGANPGQQTLTIKHYGADLVNYWDDAPNAYNAYGYRLMVYDRWGGLVYDKTVVDYTGLEQSEIKWNGRYGGTGSVLANGVYNFKLWLFNCSYPGGKQVIDSYSYHCRWRYWLLGWICGDSAIEVWREPSGIWEVDIVD